MSHKDERTYLTLLSEKIRDSVRYESVEGDKYIIIDNATADEIYKALRVVIERLRSCDLDRIVEKWDD